MLAVLAVSGCDVLGSGPTAVAEIPTTTRTLELQPHSGTTALDDYRRYWATVENAARTANWRDPHLADVAMGPALHAVRQRLYSWSRTQRVAKGRVDLRPVVLSADTHVARLSDCIDSSAWTLHPSARGTTAQPAPTSPRGRDHALVTMTRVEGRWKVAGLHFDQVRSC